MFAFTMNKNGLRKAGAVALCAVCLAGTVGLANHFAGRNIAAQASADQSIDTTQDIADYFTGQGFEIDLASAAVDKVKIPKKWDDSFLAFNTVVAESGGSLEKYKGKTVEKWTALCPALSSGDQQTDCVLLVYKTKPIGAYLREQPSGEVTGLKTAAAQQSQQAAAEQFGQEALESGAEGEADVQADVQADAQAAAEEAQQAAAEADPDTAWPVE